MKISGFTIIKNAIINDYPIVEAISSILPVVDEMIVLIGDCEDDTISLIQSIDNKKVKIHHSVWDVSLRDGGKVLAMETNKAFALINSESTWAFYIQGDEVLSEQYTDAVRATCKKYANDLDVDGLLFKYLHFYATYDYVGDSRNWYRNEIRIIRNDKNIVAYRDAQGFRKLDNSKLCVKRAGAYIHHYGWVKSPERMKEKIKNTTKFWNGDKEVLAVSNAFNFNDFDSLQHFTGIHPAVMHERIQKKNWDLRLDISKKKMSLIKSVLYIFEKLTGYRLFEYKNYKLLR